MAITGGAVGGFLSVAQGGTFSDGFASGVMTGMISGAIAGGIAGYNSMPNAPSGDFYSDVGTDPLQPCANLGTIVMRIIIAAAFAYVILKKPLEELYKNLQELDLGKKI